MKKTAIAHPIQGLVKYHGLADPRRRIPYHGSISVATAPIATRTTVEVADDLADDEINIDGVDVVGRAKERALAVLDGARAVGEVESRVRVVSRSDFPQRVGLGSSASGFAALAVAACSALELPLDLPEMSELARLGAGSATRSVTGGFSEWITRGPRSYGRALAGPGELDWKTIAVTVRSDSPTEAIHSIIRTSPFFGARLDGMEGTLDAARDALRTKDAEALMRIAEADTMNLHAVTMTTQDAPLLWRATTVEAMHAVRGLRSEGVPAYFSIDTGATVYVNTVAEHVNAVRNALGDLVPESDLLPLEPGPAAALVSDHLF